MCRIRCSCSAVSYVVELFTYNIYFVKEKGHTMVAACSYSEPKNIWYGKMGQLSPQMNVISRRPNASCLTWMGNACSLNSADFN